MTILCLFGLSSCGDASQEFAFTKDNETTLQGIETSSVGIDFSNVDPGLVCAGGGVLIFSFYDSNSDKFFQSGEEIIKTKTLCNGIDGANGSVGANGTSIIPVKFCQNDNSLFAEYGLMIGDELFAVYWGVTPGSPSVPQASLVKLIPGNYMSTGGDNCLFTIN